MLALIVAACGPSSNPPIQGTEQTGAGQPSSQVSGGSGRGVGNGLSPTLGITSIRKVQSSKAIRKLRAVNSSCTTSVAAHTIDMTDGTVWITQAYLILDEIEFHLTNDPDNEDFEEISAGPFAIDLTGTDPLVPENIDHAIPARDYLNTKFRFKPIDDTNLPRNLGEHLAAFRSEFTGPAGNQHPTILIKGCMQRDGGGDDIRFFSLITDLDLRLRADFLPGKMVDPEKQDIVFLADLPAAFQDSGARVRDLFEEVTKPGDPLGPDFLDGRSFAGSPMAQLIAENIPTHFQVFTQAAGTFKKGSALATNADPVSGSLSIER